MIVTIARPKYDVVMVCRDNKQMAKVYVWHDGKVTNLYVRKAYRGDKSVLDELADAVKMIYRAYPKLYGYASPKAGKDKQEALKRLYRRYGAVNVSGNKMVLK